MSSQPKSDNSWFSDKAEEWTLKELMMDFGPFGMLFILIIIFSIQTDLFLTYNNIVGSVFTNSAILLIVALAGTFPIMQQSIDLSVASLVTLAGVTTATLVGEFGLFALPIAVAVTTVAGTINGVVFAKLKIPSFLVTLGTLSIIEGAALIITGGSTVPFRNETVRQFAIGEYLPGIPNLILWTLIIYILTVFFAYYTKFGRFTYALGDNEKVVELSGVQVDRYKIYAFLLSGLLCGLAGALLASRISSGSAQMASGLLLPSIAAIVMGGTALTGGVGGPHRTILGVLVISVLRNGMNLTGVGPYIQEIVLGIVVIGAVGLSIDRRKIDIVK